MRPKNASLAILNVQLREATNNAFAGASLFLFHIFTHANVVILDWCSDYLIGARLTKYLTTVLRSSYDNAEVTIDLRYTSN